MNRTPQPKSRSRLAASVFNPICCRILSSSQAPLSSGGIRELTFWEFRLNFCGTMNFGGGRKRCQIDCNQEG
ncbi:hypothetical protein MesoLj113a_43910 [Mesorhizobium sp. 113-1-2]|nr:Uncharacterized protein yhdP [Mesorhizobium loti]BCG73233.1 hypothetical protein MesoLj113a_43910 [Mesorhizobium sp. 113-1-2]